MITNIFIQKFYATYTNKSFWIWFVETEKWFVFVFIFYLFLSLFCCSLLFSTQLYVASAVLSCLVKLMTLQRLQWLKSLVYSTQIHLTISISVRSSSMHKNTKFPPNYREIHGAFVHTQKLKQLNWFVLLIVWFACTQWVACSQCFVIFISIRLRSPSQKTVTKRNRSKKHKAVISIFRSNLTIRAPCSK